MSGLSPAAATGGVSGPAPSVSESAPAADAPSGGAGAAGAAATLTATVTTAAWLGRPRRLRSAFAAERLAVSVLFFCNGALFATWVSRIPAIQTRHALSHAALGLALLVMALGAVIAMPAAGMLIGRFRSAPVCKVAATLYCLMLPCLALAPGHVTLVLALLCFGAAHGALDVSMNAEAVDVETRYRRPIMSSFHALFSLGGLTGAAAGVALTRLSLAPLTHFLLAALLLGAAAMVIFPKLASHPLHLTPAAQPDPRTKPAGRRTAFPWPSRGLLALGVVALCSMVGEGAMADWSALFLRDVRHTSESFAAAGYAAFSVAMAASRFGGDWLTATLGAVRLVRWGGLTATAGTLVALLLPGAETALIGFACVGLGLATIVPAVFSAAGRLPGVAPGTALATVTTLGYFGFIAAPPLIGLVAELIGLRGALGSIVLTSAGIALLAPALATPAPANRET